MDISLISAIDDSSKRIAGKVFPLAIESLKDSNRDNTFNGFKLSKLRSGGFLTSSENVVLSVSFDPTSCRIPIDFCPGSCSECGYNPIPHLLDPYSRDCDRQYVITGRDTINSLLDLIVLLANANKGNIL